MESWRLLADDGAGAAEGLAVDQSLMGAYAGRASAPTLRLYTYRSHCALIGRFQDVTAELNLEECRNTGTEVNRRPTGGGAIVMGEDQLGLALVTHLRREDTPPHAAAIVKKFGEAVAGGLARLGIRGEVRGKNDIAVEGRKIAGLGVYIDEHDSVLFHASVLVDLDVPFMLRVLNVPAAKLADKGVAAVGDRITTVKRLTGSAVTTADVRESIVAGFQEHFAVGFDRVPLTKEEHVAAERTAIQRYRDPAWVALRSTGEAPEGSSLLKTPGGLLRINVMLDGEALKSVTLTGDFMATDRALIEIEAALRWASPDRKRIAASIARGVESGGGLTAVSNESLTEAVWQAVIDAKARRGMTTGSCYYPPAPVSDKQLSGRNA